MARLGTRALIPAAALVVWVACHSGPQTSGDGGSSTGAQPASLTAHVYARTSTTAYQPDGPFAATPVAGAVIQLGSTLVASTTADGTAKGTTSQTGYLTFSATASGFMPMILPDDVAAGSARELDVGMYPLPAASPQPGFVKGIALWDAGGWTKSVFLKNGSFLSTIGQLREKASAGVVAFSDTANAQGSTAATLGITSSAQGSYWGMLSETDYATVVGAAHGSGLAYMMMLGVYSLDADYSATIWGIPAGDPAFWDRWFQQYTDVVTRYAAIARNLGVEYLSLGLNLGYASRTPVSRWRALVAAVRQTGYRGEIGYFGYTDPTRGYYENRSYPAGFLDLFDFIGASVYTVTSTAQPTRDQLVAGWRTIESNLPSNRRVFLLIGTPSSDRGASDPTYIEPIHSVSPIADAYRRDYFQQADVYEAAFETLGDDGVASARVAGLFSWGYYYQDNYRDLVQPGDMAVDKAASIRNKPAQAVVRWWFERF